MRKLHHAQSAVREKLHGWENRHVCAVGKDGIIGVALPFYAGKSSIPVRTPWCGRLASTMIVQASRLHHD